MDKGAFDRFTRALAGRLSRRGVIRGAAVGSVAGPGAGLVAAAQDSGRGRRRDRGDQCRKAGEQCDGGQVCCGGLTCQTIAGGLSTRCLPPGASASGSQTTVASSVCAGDCAGEASASASSASSSSASVGTFGTFPLVTIDVDCQFDAAAFQTVCLALGGVPDGGPVITDIGLPFDGVCAVTIDAVFRPPRFEEIVSRKPAPAGEGGQASAGTGGAASADASGGAISIGDIDSGGNTGASNETTVNVSAEGGTANADASGGDNNVAIAGGGTAGEVVRELRQIDPASLTVVLEGNVVPGRHTTWWIETDRGRLPASGPSLDRVADATPADGSIAVTGFACPDATAETEGDWFGRCADPAVPFDLTLTPVEPVGTATSRRLNDLGRTRFTNLAPGRYRLDAASGAWCRAESDAVNEAGEVVVEAGRESNVWVFTCPSS